MSNQQNDVFYETKKEAEEEREATFIIRKKNGKYILEKYEVDFKNNPPPLMMCGHTATSLWHSPKELGNKKIWCCVICDGEKSRIVEENPLDLKNRYAKCAYCNSMEPSSFNLPFFEYNGSNKGVPQELIDNFYKLLKEGWDKGYSGKHDPEDSRTFPKELDDRVELAREKIKKARKYDEYYCGCKGWD